MLKKICSFRDDFLPHKSQPPNCRAHNDSGHPGIGLVLDIQNPRELYNETCTAVEVQIYPEHNLHHFSLIPKVYFAGSVQEHSGSHTRNPLAVSVQTPSHSTSSQRHTQEKRTWHHTTLADKDMGCR